MSSTDFNSLALEGQNEGPYGAGNGWYGSLFGGDQGSTALQAGYPNAPVNGAPASAPTGTFNLGSNLPIATTGGTAGAGGYAGPSGSSGQSPLKMLLSQLLGFSSRPPAPHPINRQTPARPVTRPPARPITRAPITRAPITGQPPRMPITRQPIGQPARGPIAGQPPRGPVAPVRQAPTAPRPPARPITR